MKGYFPGTSYKNGNGNLHLYVLTLKGGLIVPILFWFKVSSKYSKMLGTPEISLDKLLFTMLPLVFLQHFHQLSFTNNQSKNETHAFGSMLWEIEIWLIWSSHAAKQGTTVSLFCFILLYSPNWPKTSFMQRSDGPWNNT